MSIPLFLLMTVCLVLVKSFPQNQIGFPDDYEESPGRPGEDGLGDRQGFRPRPGSRPGQGFQSQGFQSRPGGNLRPPGGNFGRPPFPGDDFGSFNNPGNNFGTGGQPGNNFGTGGQPGNNFGTGSQPGNNFGTGGQPGNNFGTGGPAGNNFGTGGHPGNNFGTSGQPGNNFGSSNNNNQRPNSNPQNPLGGNNIQNTGNQTQTPIATSTASSTGETTTRIPPRDPTNRIVYIVSCPCQFTRQYTPVCGTDGQTYGNLGVLQCAQQCGTDVSVFLMGACVGNRGG